MATTINDLVFIDATGYNYADFPSFLSWLQGQYQSVYGADVYLGSDSQDGQWVGIQAQALYDTAAAGAVAYLSFSPASAQGAGLSRVVKINGIRREIPTNSSVELVIVGTYGTNIIDGIAVDTLQQQWVLPTPLLIPISGTLTETAFALNPGAINALPNTITQIFTPTLGWQTVNNPAAATPGAPVESDAALRNRQKISTANPSLTVFDGTLGAVGNVTGVTKFQGYENDTNTTDGNGLPPHSISIIAQGGTDADVAAAIQVHKTPGTQTYGTTTVNTFDSRGMPVTINFYRPTVATIGVQVTIVTFAGWTDDYDVLIQNAVAAFVNAIPIGGIIYYTQLYLVAYLQGTAAFGTFEIVSIELQLNGGGFSAANITLPFNDIPVCNPSTDVVVTP